LHNSVPLFMSQKPVISLKFIHPVTTEAPLSHSTMDRMPAHWP
jgi:hypothetical protein